MQNLPPSRGPNESHESNARPRLQAPVLNSLPGPPILTHPDYSTTLPERRMQPFYSPHDMGSVSPNESGPVPIDPYRQSGPGGGAPSPNHLTAMMMHNPKRAYRQRRKDPSCDACRERKVKCDATETSSCTECSSRNVRCQFTKDTNRRMSSIKQVQDLERQLHDARQQLERARASEQKIESPTSYSVSPTQVFSELPTMGKSPRRMLKARTPSDLGYARTQLSDIGRGLLKPPVTSAHPRPHEAQTLLLPQLPARPLAEQLLQAYYEGLHRRFPVLYWPEFQQNFLSIYERSATTMIARETAALLFAVLACGTLHLPPSTRVQEGQEYLSHAIDLINMWEEDVCMTQSVVVFLVSLFFAEVNRKSASWIWLGSAIRVGQNLGLHVQGGQWSAVEGEMRKRIWYSFYAWDRLLATELGKPMLINDDECDTEYPESLDEEIAGGKDPLGPQQPTFLLATIHIARLLSPLAKLCRSLCITNETLNKFESHLWSCLYLFPAQLQLSSNTSLDPCVMAPIIYFQNTRLMLHRHNMSPSCSPEQRYQAISQCAAVARDTAGLISRCLMPQPQLHESEQRLVIASTTLLCTHLWRCMLFLVFRQLYDPFLVLFRASALINDTKPINISCGRHLSFFLQRLIARYEEKGVVDSEQDEELLVYLSGDLQASTNSWVWGNAETGTLLSRRQKHGRPRHTAQEVEQSPSTEQSLSWNSMLSDEERHKWGGWEQIERSARYLQQIQEKLQSPLQTPGPVQYTLPPLSQTHDLSFSRPSAVPPMTSAPQIDVGRSRMTIANII